MFDRILDAVGATAHHKPRSPRAATELLTDFYSLYNIKFKMIYESVFMNADTVNVICYDYKYIEI